MPRRASSLRYSGSKTIMDRSSSTSPLCLGMPNFVGKSLRIWATGCISMVSIRRFSHEKQR